VVGVGIGGLDSMGPLPHRLVLAHFLYFRKNALLITVTDPIAIMPK
jgi:hypothetical protein